MNSPIEFEILVKDLYNGKADGFTVFHNKKYTGLKSGHNHQIDFSMEGNIAGFDMRILGECKQYKNPVSLEKVMAFAYRIIDTSAHKGILVSSNGFQEGAFKIAKSAGIALVICRNHSLDTVLARSKKKTEDISTFLNTITAESGPIEYALLVSDETCKSLDHDKLLNEMIAE